MELEPLNSLIEGLLLGEDLGGLFRIAPHREPVLDARVHRHLVGDASRLEKPLHLPSVLAGEDLVVFYACCD